jgi:hypothetical protein
MPRRFCPAAALAPLLLLIVGCNAAPALPKTYPATGSVVYKGGAPMPGGSIQLVAPDDPLLRVVGAVGTDGAFTLYTLRDNAKAEGAPAGEFKVVVTPPLVDDRRGGLKDPHKGVMPITLTKSYRIEAKENMLKIELPTAAPRP